MAGEIIKYLDGNKLVSKYVFLLFCSFAFLFLRADCQFG